MRNQNYYRSVVKEFFPKEQEKYRDAVLAQNQVTGDEAKQHQCFCNMCGDDITTRAQGLADARFNVLRENLTKEQAQNKSKANGDAQNEPMGENEMVDNAKM